MHGATTFYNLEIIAILLVNTKKSLKFCRFGSAQNLVSFIDLNFFCMFLAYFAAKAGIVFNFFLNFEQKLNLVQGRRQLTEIRGAKLKTGGQSFDGKLLQYFES